MLEGEDFLRFFLSFLVEGLIVGGGPEVEGAEVAAGIGCVVEAHHRVIEDGMIPATDITIEIIAIGGEGATVAVDRAVGLEVTVEGKGIEETETAIGIETAGGAVVEAEVRAGAHPVTVGVVAEV